MAELGPKARPDEPSFRGHRRTELLGPAVTSRTTPGYDVARGSPWGLHRATLASVHRCREGPPRPGSGRRSSGGRARPRGASGRISSGNETRGGADPPVVVGPS